MGRQSVSFDGDDDRQNGSIRLEDHELETYPVDGEEAEKQKENFHKAAYDILETQIHESSDAPPFAVGTFIWQTLIHVTFPWSLPIFFVLAGKDRWKVCRRQGLIPLLKSEVPPGGTYGKALFALFQYGYVWPLLAQLTLVVALVKPEALYEHALTEAIISFIFFVSHRMTIGAKYAGLSDRERRRLLHEEPVPVSLALNWRLQVVSGWTLTPAREVLLAEMELASAENGVDLCDLWLEVAEDTYTVRYMDSLAPAAESNANGDGFGEDGVEEPRCKQVLKEFICCANNCKSCRSIYPTGLRDLTRPGASKRSIAVNGGALAVALVYRSFAFTDPIQKWMGHLCMLLTLVQVFLPAMVRAAYGATPFGTDVYQILFFVACAFVRFRGYVVLNMYLFNTLLEYMRRAHTMRTLSAMIRLPLRDPTRDQGGSHAIISAQLRKERVNTRARRLMTRFRSTVSYKRESHRQIPVLNMHCRETVSSWLLVRSILYDFATRFRIRLLTYFTVMLVLILAEIVWILIIHRADFRKPVDHLDLGSAESILLAVPAALTLLLMLAAGAAVNEEHENQEDTLMEHRLLLREWAPEATEEALKRVGIATGRPQLYRHWLVDHDTDDLLRIAAATVGRTKKLRVFGLAATPTLVQAYASMLISGAVLAGTLATDLDVQSIRDSVGV